MAPPMATTRVRSLGDLGPEQSQERGGHRGVQAARRPGRRALDTPSPRPTWRGSSSAKTARPVPQKAEPGLPLVLGGLVRQGHGGRLVDDQVRPDDAVERVPRVRASGPGAARTTCCGPEDQPRHGAGPRGAAGPEHADEGELRATREGEHRQRAGLQHREPRGDAEGAVGDAGRRRPRRRRRPSRGRTVRRGRLPVAHRSGSRGSSPGPTWSASHSMSGRMARQSLRTAGERLRGSPIQSAGG